MQDGSPDFGVRHVHPGCQPPSDEGCCRDARSPGPRLTHGEVKTTPKASVTPHQQQPPKQQPQPRHTTLPRLRPRTWTWITPNAYLPRVCFGRRPAVRRKPHNPGAGPGPRPVALPEAFGGNRRLHTAAAPAADRLRPIQPHDYRCNLQCILRVVFKKHRFLQGFVAFAVSRFHLGDVKKPWVFHGFGS